MELLNRKQQQAYDLFLNNESFFISGPGGTGKSYLIKQFQRHYIGQTIRIGDKMSPIAVTAMTGSAAVQINGQTLHSWAGIFDGSLTAEQYIEKINKSKYYSKAWKRTECLIIDEVSMLTSELFDKLNIIAQEIRDSDEPMGGLQTILVGDFFQLPPVERGKSESSFCFESKYWKQLIKKNIILDEIIRQDNPYFQQMLNEIRQGICSKKTEKDLKRIQKSTKKMNFEQFEIRPTQIYSYNKDVDQVNKNFLKSLKQEIITYDSIIEEEEYERAIKKDKMYKGISDRFLDQQKNEVEPEKENEEQKENEEEEIDDIISKLENTLVIDGEKDKKNEKDEKDERDKKNEKEESKKKLYQKLKQDTTSLPNKLEISTQSQVMLIKNIDVKKGLVNGSRGIIIDFEESETSDASLPVIKFLNGEQIRIDYYEMYLYDHQKNVCIKKKQLPLKLAWAVSQHKCQGVTLDTAIIDIGNKVFTCGQSYVALSRCKTLERLYIINFEPSKIKANKKVIAFYKNLEKQQEEQQQQQEQEEEQ